MISEVQAKDTSKMQIDPHLPDFARQSRFPRKQGQVASQVLIFQSKGNLFPNEPPDSTRDVRGCADPPMVFGNVSVPRSFVDLHKGNVKSRSPASSSKGIATLGPKSLVFQLPRKCFPT
ncbi:hypothetical protein M569_17270 [Genlisea aurea]|uniref:Uncharacterized protein n=1 Tax=Genlisea aurea TaxID=192259 RepID=S8DDU6_9LAMI|nr:hypothetical protein M569_17270 [Genlisea aurea]